MELNDKKYKVYKNIDFANRYENLSNRFQSEKELKFSDENAIELICSLGYSVKYIKKNSFFKLEERIDNLKFYLNISLKYSIAELIIGATNLQKDEFITGGGFGAIYHDIKDNEGNGFDIKIKKPSFSNYEDLKEILKETFCIYEDFKQELLKQKLN